MPYKSMFLMMLVILCFSVCSCGGGAKSEQHSSDTPPEKTEDTMTGGELTGEGLLGDKSTLKSLDDSAIKDAHNFLPQYPEAILDKNKGSVNKSETGDEYNLVYYTHDSVIKVAEFFRSNIAEQYLTENSSPDGDEWVHFEYNVEGVRQNGSIFIRRTVDKQTEIVYLISYKNKID